MRADDCQRRSVVDDGSLDLGFKDAEIEAPPLVGELRAKRQSAAVFHDTAILADR